MRRDVERENTATGHSLSHFTWDILTFEQFHIITFDQFNIITLAVKESFSANQYRQDQWTVRFGVPWHVILNLSMSPDTIRAIYLGPLHFVDYDGWDQTSFIVPGTGLLVILCNAAHVFSLLACEKKRFYHLGLNNVNKQLYQLISSVILLFLPKKVSSWEKFTRVWLLNMISTIDQHNKHDKTRWT